MRSFWLLSAIVLTVAPAHADPARDALAKVAKCADVAAAIERLQCYDQAAAEAKTAISTPVEAVPQQQTAAAEEEGGILSWFGLEGKKPVTKPEEFGKPPAAPAAVAGPKEITEISSSVVELARNAYGRSIFILENGQVWKQIDGDSTEVRDPSKGEAMKVTIEKSLFGSFSLSIEGRRGIVKVRRVK